MMTPWVIEPVGSAAELEAVLAIEQASFTNPWTREMYLSELANSGTSFLYVARDPDGHIVGFCAFWHISDELHINNLAVAPQRRRAGVASALLEHVLQEGTLRGAGRASLEVRQSNQAALCLYERFGFIVAGLRRNYYSNPTEDALILWRDGHDVGGS